MCVLAGFACACWLTLHVHFLAGLCIAFSSALHVPFCVRFLAHIVCSFLASGMASQNAHARSACKATQKAHAKPAKKHMQCEYTVSCLCAEAKIHFSRCMIPTGGGPYNQSTEERNRKQKESMRTTQGKRKQD